jgi:hypothetical protein
LVGAAAEPGSRMGIAEWVGVGGRGMRGAQPKGMSWVGHYPKIGIGICS